MNIGYEAKRIFHNKTGLGNYSRDLVRILSEAYPENNYFLYNPKPAKKELFKAISTHVFEKRPAGYFAKKFKNFWRQKGIINDLVRDEIVIFHGLSGELPSGLRQKNIKSVVTIHDLIFMRYPEFYSFFDRKIHYYKFKKAAQQADSIIAISEQTKKDIITFLAIPEKKIKVIYQGCQSVFKEDYSEKEKEETSRKFNLPKEYLLNVGTIESRKNVLSVVKAIKTIDTHLVIIGSETKYSVTVKKYIADNNLEQKVSFLNGLTARELVITYQLSTIFVYPSLFEGFGIPIIEALYSKTPVITSNSGVFPEAGGPHSVYVDPTNISEMETKIRDLLANKALRNEISEKGYTFVQQFNDKTIATEVMALYQSI
jgi:glycosyltransferase involved in cell wall biosynthesis